MFALNISSQTDERVVLKALGRSLAIIEFDLSGTILSANENFCNALGYSLSEIKGQHHCIFVEPDYAHSPEYKAFWAKLGRGEFDARESKRIGKDGREVWLQASYNPVINPKGVVVKIVTVATDVTAEKLRTSEFEGKIAAILRVQAVIEFTPSGEIITANENFLSLIGYRLEEIKGRHHSLFVEFGEANSPDYQEFWRKLNRGEFVNASFKRIGKGGKEVWIQGSYNPIFDMNRKVIKVVKFATDITDLTEIGAGLARLAANNLEQEIEKPFIPAFENLRLDFNSAHRSLQGPYSGSPTSPRQFTQALKRYRRGPTTCRTAPSSKPPVSKRPLQRSKKSQRRSRNLQKGRPTRARSLPPPTTTPRKARSSSTKRSRPWTRSPHRRGRSARSSA